MTNEFTEQQQKEARERKVEYYRNLEQNNPKAFTEIIQNTVRDMSCDQYQRRQLNGTQC